MEQQGAGLVWAVLRHLQRSSDKDMAAPVAEGDLGRGTLPAAKGGRSATT